jgi:phosphatidylserine decarboxylase
MTSCPLPPYFRVALYKAFGMIYGVKFEEAKQQDLNKFRTFNQFFTRELNEEARPIANQHNDKSLTSPCDGTVLSFGEVNAMTSTIECVKGNDYKLSEFLFGPQATSNTVDQKALAVDNMLASMKASGRKAMYMVIYLSPGDYHRFHSPANFTANYRRHIAGYLEPVDPRYLARHGDVLKSNERVNILGDWSQGFFAMSFVGATNVGSINLHFDESLVTNSAQHTSVHKHSDKNYTTLTAEEGGIWTYPVLKKKLNAGVLGSVSASKPESHSESISIDDHLHEFDVKDMTWGGGEDADFTYSP